MYVILVQSIAGSVQKRLDTLHKHNEIVKMIFVFGLLLKNIEKIQVSSLIGISTDSLNRYAFN
jgi:hypothetical protein